MSLHLSRRDFIRLTLLAVNAFNIPLQRLFGKTSLLANKPTQIDLTAIAVTIKEVDLTWSGVVSSHAPAQYVIKRDGQILTRVSGSTLGYTDNDVQPRQSYVYTVEAQMGELADAVTSNSATVNTPLEPETPDLFPPSIPEELTVEAFPGYILLDWYASSDDTDVSCYLIQRDGQRLALVNGATGDFRDSTVIAGHQYAYTVEAIDTVGHHSDAAKALGIAARQHSTFLPSVANSEPPIEENTRQVSAVLTVSTKLRRYPYLTDLVGPYVTINWATDNTVTTGSITYGEVGVEAVNAHTVTATRFGAAAD